MFITCSNYNAIILRFIILIITCNAINKRNIFQFIAVTDIAIGIQLSLLLEIHENEKIVVQPQPHSEIISSVLSSIKIIKNRINLEHSKEKQNNNKENIFLSLWSDIINKNKFYILEYQVEPQIFVILSSAISIITNQIEIYNFEKNKNNYNSITLCLLPINPFANNIFIQLSDSEIYTSSYSSSLILYILSEQEIKIFNHEQNNDGINKLLSISLFDTNLNENKQIMSNETSSTISCLSFSSSIQ